MGRLHLESRQYFHPSDVRLSYKMITNRTSQHSVSVHLWKLFCAVNCRNSVQFIWSHSNSYM